jgi:HPt (histidine-containing phosphotransfer) domain-containing protein
MNETSFFSSQEIEARLREFREEFGPEMVAQVIEIFSSDARLRLERLTAKLAAGNARELADEAHGLKGSCYNVGARQLGDLCLLLEDYGKSGTLEGAQVVLAELAPKLMQVLRFLETERETEPQAI